MIVEVTLLIAAGVGNLAWDVTGRRVSARARRRARHERRRVSVPTPTDDEHAHDPFEHVDAIAPPGFVELTRTIVEELDRVVDHFDLVQLRAEASATLVGDVVYIGAEAPRARAHALLERWLAEVGELSEHVTARLRDFGMPDQSLRELLEREQARSRRPYAYTSQDLIAATAGELEGAVVRLAVFLRALTNSTADPYR